jgi:hypothetical protein
MRSVCKDLPGWGDFTEWRVWTRLTDQERRLFAVLEALKTVEQEQGSERTCDGPRGRGSGDARKQDRERGLAPAPSVALGSRCSQVPWLLGEPGPTVGII